jgi:hypothetical protein
VGQAVLPLMVRTLGSASVAELYGGTTLVVQAFDLGLFVPLVPFTAVTVHRRMVAGYVMSAIVVLNSVALGIGIAAMLVIEYLATDALQPVPIALFLATAAASGVLAVRVFRSIQPPSASLAVRISEAVLSATVRPTIPVAHLGSVRRAIETTGSSAVVSRSTVMCPLDLELGPERPVAGSMCRVIVTP